MRHKAVLILLGLTVAALPLLATDDPHGQAFNVQCTNSCHNRRESVMTENRKLVIPE